MDIDFNELDRRLAMEDVDEALQELAKKNPEAVAFFMIGRTVGRMDIISKLIKILNDEAKNAKEIKNVLDELGGKKNG